MPRDNLHSTNKRQRICDAPIKPGKTQSPKLCSADIRQSLPETAFDYSDARFQLGVVIGDKCNTQVLEITTQPTLLVRCADLATVLDQVCGWKACTVHNDLPHGLVYVPKSKMTLQPETFNPDHDASAALVSFANSSMNPSDLESLPPGITVPGAIWLFTPSQIETLETLAQEFRAAMAAGHHSITREIAATVHDFFAVPRLRLFAHQETLRDAFRNHNWQAPCLQEHVAFGLYWKMGSGKTDGFAKLTLGSDTQPPPKRMLIVTSGLVQQSFTDTFLRTMIGRSIAPDEDFTCHITITGYREFQLRYLEFLDLYDVVAMDEAQEFKAMTRTTEFVLHTIRRTAKRYFMLTGTPIMSSVNEVASLLVQFGENVQPFEGGFLWHRRKPGSAPQPPLFLPQQSMKQLLQIAREHGYTLDAFQRHHASGTSPPGLQQLQAALAAAWPSEALQSVLANRVSYFTPEIHGFLDWRDYFPQTRRQRIPVQLSLCHSIRYLLCLSSKLRFQEPAWMTENPQRPRHRTLVKRSCNRKGCMEKRILAEPDPITQRNPRLDTMIEILCRPCTCFPAVVYVDCPFHDLEDMATTIEDLCMEVTHDGPSASSPPRVVAPCDQAPRIPYRRLRVGLVATEIPMKERVNVCDDFNLGGLDVLVMSNIAAQGISLHGAGSFLRVPAASYALSEQIDARVLRAAATPQQSTHIDFYDIVCTLHPLLRHRSNDSLKAALETASQDDLAAIDRAISSLLQESTWDDFFDQAPSRTAVFLHVIQELQRHAQRFNGPYTIDEIREYENSLHKLQTQEYHRAMEAASIDVPRGTMRPSPEAHRVREALREANLKEEDRNGAPSQRQQALHRVTFRRLYAKPVLHSLFAVLSPRYCLAQTKDIQQCPYTHVGSLRCPILLQHQDQALQALTPHESALFRRLREFTLAIQETLGPDAQHTFCQTHRLRPVRFIVVLRMVLCWNPEWLESEPRYIVESQRFHQEATMAAAAVRAQVQRRKQQHVHQCGAPETSSLSRSINASRGSQETPIQ